MDLIQYLIKEKRLNKDQEINLRGEIKKTNKSIEKVILDSKLISEPKLFDLKSRFLKVPLRRKFEEKVLPEVLSIIPKESVEFYKMIPLAFRKQDKVLEIGMVSPEDNQAKEALKFLARQQRFTPDIFLITLTDFRKYLERYQVPEKEMEKALQRLEKEIARKPEKEMAPTEFKRLVEEAPIIKMVAVILRQGVEGKASDIHIEPAQENLKIRYRLDGILYSSLILPLKIHPAVVARIKILSGLKIDETRIPQDGRFSTIVGDKKIDFRVASFPTNMGEKVALRILDPGEGVKKLPDLGLRNRNLKLVGEAIKKPYGMILSTGPTGSGKSTTLYALLGILNKEGVNIVTLEDPIEYFIEGVNQSQIKPDIGYSFASGLRQILRQDPDIIMVGEIRDEETASLAVHAGLTGHLVLSTLHTTNVVGVIPRLIDMGIEPFLISPTLSLAISQRLIRILCKDCRQKAKADGEEKRYILNKIRNLPAQAKQGLKIPEPIYVYKPKGCKKCNAKGYAGRIAVFEVIEITPAMSRIINDKSREEDIVREARKQGMITMEEDGILKVLDGITSLEEVMRVTKEV